MLGTYIEKKIQACNIQEQTVVDSETLTNKSEAAFPTQLSLMPWDNYGPFLDKRELHEEGHLAWTLTRFTFFRIYRINNSFLYLLFVLELWGIKLTGIKQRELFFTVSPYFNSP